ncbi:MAG: VOC family protein [Burkholderiales bacterium]|nr:MAG: VOC family protein [Burkholderiales bacterium]
MSEDAGSGLGVIGQIALHVSDVDRAERFYRDTLGLPPLFRFGNLVFLDCAGVRLMLEGGHESTGRREQFCVYFRVSQIEAVVAALRARQVYFERDPQLVARMPDHELWMAFMHDPDGNLLALMEEKR